MAKCKKSEHTFVLLYQILIILKATHIMHLLNSNSELVFRQYTITVGIDGIEYFHWIDGSILGGGGG